MSGFADAASVGTWPDRCGTANATQATEINQPTFRVNQFGGQAVVRFDGSNNFMTFTSAAGSAMSFIAARKDAVAGGIVLGRDSGEGLDNVQYLRSFSSKSLAYSDPPNNSLFQSASNTTTTTPAINFQSYTTSFPMQFWDNGVNIGQSAQNWDGSLGVNCIGIIRQNNTFFVPLNGDVGAAIVFLSNIAGTAIQKRVQHHLAFLFKIPCS